ncbi:MAG: transcriptional regulator [Bacteroidetes bacterium]|nr:MAG: transcriptional regulator [Bacteroidota bacterium]
MNISDRLIQYLDFKGITKNKFYLVTGLSNGFLDKKPNIGADKVERIINLYPDLNLYWLINGQGSMIVKSNDDLALNDPQHKYSIKCKLCAEKDEVISALKEANSALRQLIENLSSDSPRNGGYKQTG